MTARARTTSKLLLNSNRKEQSFIFSNPSLESIVMSISPPGAQTCNQLLEYHLSTS